MIFDFFSKNKLAKWWNKRRDDIKASYDQMESDYISELELKKNTMIARMDEVRFEIEDRLKKLEREKEEVAFQESRVRDRQAELARINDELKQQIRLSEAKASPDNIWTHAFTQGVSKSWDMMIPIMMDGIEKVKEAIRNQEVEASFPRIDAVVEQRLKDVGSYNLLESHTLEAKKRQFQLQLTKANDPLETAKLETSIRLIDWVLGERNGH